MAADSEDNYTNAEHGGAITAAIDIYGTRTERHVFESGAQTEVVTFASKAGEGKLVLFRELNTEIGQVELTSYAWLGVNSVLHRVELEPSVATWLRYRLQGQPEMESELSAIDDLVARPFYIVEEAVGKGQNLRYLYPQDRSTLLSPYANLEAGEGSPEVVTPEYQSASDEDRIALKAAEPTEKLIAEAKDRVISTLRNNLPASDLPVVAELGESQVVLVPATEEIQAATTVNIRNVAQGKEVVKQNALSGKKYLLAEVQSSEVVRFVKPEFMKANSVDPSLGSDKVDPVNRVLRAVAKAVGYDVTTFEQEKSALMSELKSIDDTPITSNMQSHVAEIRSRLRRLESGKSQYEAVTNRLLYLMRQSSVQVNAGTKQEDSSLKAEPELTSTDPALLYSAEELLKFLDQSPDLRAYINDWRATSIEQTLAAYMEPFSGLSLDSRLSATEFTALTHVGVSEALLAEALAVYGAEPALGDWQDVLLKIATETVEKQVPVQVDGMIVAAGKYQMLEQIVVLEDGSLFDLLSNDLRQKSKQARKKEEISERDEVILANEGKVRTLAYEKASRLVEVKQSLRDIWSETGDIKIAMERFIVTMMTEYPADMVVVEAARNQLTAFSADKARYGSYTDESLFNTFATVAASSIFDREVRLAGIALLGNYRVSGHNDLDKVFSIEVAVHDAVPMDRIAVFVQKYEAWEEVRLSEQPNMIERIEKLEALGVHFNGSFVDLVDPELLEKFVTEANLSRPEYIDLLDVLDVLMPLGSWGAHETPDEILTSALEVVRPVGSQDVPKVLKIMVGTGGHPKMGLLLGSYLDSLVAAEAANQRRQRRRSEGGSLGGPVIGQELQLKPVFLIAHNAAGVVNHYDAPELREVNSYVAELNYQTVQRYLQLPFVRAEVLGVSEAELANYPAEAGVIEIEKLEDRTWSEGSATLAFQEVGLPYVRELYVERGEGGSIVCNFAQTVKEEAGLNDPEVKKLNEVVGRAVVEDKDLAYVYKKAGEMVNKVGQTKVESYLFAAKALREVVEMGKKRNKGKMSEEQIVENSMRYAVMHTIYFGDLIVPGLDLLEDGEDQYNHIADDEGEFKGVRDYLAARLVASGKANPGRRKMDIRTRTCQARKPYYTLESLPNAWQLLDSPAETLEYIIGYLTANSTIKFQGENDEEVASRYLDTNRLLRMENYPRGMGDREQRLWRIEKERRARMYVEDVLLAVVQDNQSIVEKMRQNEGSIDAYLRKVNPKAFIFEV
jgi:hypothetical protein